MMSETITGVRDAISVASVPVIHNRGKLLIGRPRKFNYGDFTIITPIIGRQKGFEKSLFRDGPPEFDIKD